MSKQASIDVNEFVDESSQDEKEKSIRCKSCNFDITEKSFAIQPHEHTFRNPAGYSYHVLCFSDAQGAAEAGSPTDEASWFPGHVWTFAICKNCNNHLGWWYSGKKRFVGLIAQRLIR